MKISLVLSLSLLVLALSVPAYSAEKGKALFEKNCSFCHVEGGNQLHPGFTLRQEDRERHGVMTVEDIIGKMRNPKPPMPVIHQKENGWKAFLGGEIRLSDEEAEQIARYIIESF